MEGTDGAKVNFLDSLFFIFGDTLKETEGSRWNCDPSLGCRDTWIEASLPLAIVPLCPKRANNYSHFTLEFRPFPVLPWAGISEWAVSLSLDANICLCS